MMDARRGAVTGATVGRRLKRGSVRAALREVERAESPIVYGARAERFSLSIV